MRQGRLWTVILGTWLAGCGAVKTTTRVDVPPAYRQAQSASLEELIALVNDRYAAIDTLTVSRFQVEFTGGSVEAGYLEAYRKGQGYLVAARPDSIFVNILNPLTNSSILAMATQLGSFQIWLPTRNQYVTGPTEVPSREENPLYNVRPSHLLPALLIEPLTGQGEMRYFREEDQDGAAKYYVLYVVTLSEEAGGLSLQRKLWIERSRMQLVRQQYYHAGAVTSVIRYNGPVEVEQRWVPVRIQVERPEERYSMSLEFDPESIRVNRTLPPDAFEIPRPPGAEVVYVQDQPEEDSGKE